MTKQSLVGLLCAVAVLNACAEEPLEAKREKVVNRVERLLLDHAKENHASMTVHAESSEALALTFVELSGGGIARSISLLAEIESGKTAKVEIREVIVMADGEWARASAQKTGMVDAETIVLEGVLKSSFGGRHNYKIGLSPNVPFIANLHVSMTQSHDVAQGGKGSAVIIEWRIR